MWLRLCIKVKSPENNDYYILKRAVEYLAQERFKLNQEFKLSEVGGLMKAEDKNTE